MLGRTHVTVGVAAYTAIAGFDPFGIIVTALTSKLPDIDISFGHRGATHSLLAVLALYLIVRSRYPELVTPALTGCITHLILDTLTPMGVPWFWPFGERIKIPVFKTGGFGDKLITWVAVGLIFLFYRGKLV